LLLLFLALGAVYDDDDGQDDEDVVVHDDGQDGVGQANQTQHEKSGEDEVLSPLVKRLGW